MSVILWNYIYEWKEFICISAGVTILLSFVVPMAIKRFDYRNGEMAFLYLIYGLKKRQIAALAAAVLQVLLILSCILFRKNIEVFHLEGLLILQMIVVAGSLKWKDLLTGVLNSVSVFIALICANIMFRYLDEIRMDVMVLMLYLVLNLFVITYSIYMCMHHALQISRAAGKSSGRKVADEEEELEEMVYEEA